MVQLLSMLALAAPSAFADYERASLHAFAAIGNDRVVDGIPYGDGNGVISGGLVYAHPSGFFAGSELLAFHGQGVSLPDTPAAVLDSFAGWQTDLGDHRLSVELLDYRLDADSHDMLDNQGIGVRYRHHRFEVQYAYERDKPYFAAYADTFYRYDAERVSLAWRQPVSNDASWTVAAGGQQLDWQDTRHQYLSAALQWHWQEFDWHFGVVRSFGDFERLSGGDTPDHLVFRVTRSFRLR